MENNNVERFINCMDTYDVNLNAFIKLFNMWIDMGLVERNEIIKRRLI